jgi:hypothetical protein
MFSYFSLSMVPCPDFMFSLPDPISMVAWAPGPVFMFCVSGLVFDNTEGAGSSLHVLHFQTHFRRIRGIESSFT